MAPRTDSSASRFWGGTVAVCPLVAKASLLRRECPGLSAESSPSLDTGPADPRLPRSGTKSARAWLENHRPLLGAEELCLFAARVFQARFVPGAEGRCLRPLELNEWSLGLRLGTLSHLGHDGLDRGRGPAADLDLDHVGAGLTDRILEPDLLAIDLDPTCGLDRISDLGRGDGAEELAVLPGAVVDREDRLAEQRGCLAGALGGLALGLLRALALALGLLERALGGGLGQLARHEVVAQIPG